MLNAIEYGQCLRVLGLAGNASSDEIKDAYRRKLKECHPDLNRGRGNERLRAVLEAFRVLSAEEAPPAEADLAALGRSLGADRDTASRARAVRTLQTRAEIGAYACLKLAALDPDETVAFEALEGLSRWNHPRLGNDLTLLYHQVAQRTRKKILDLAGECLEGGEYARFLLSAIRDADPFLRQDALRRYRARNGVYA